MSRTYVPQYLNHVPRYLCSPALMFPFFYCNSGHWHKLFANLFLEHDSRLWLCLGHRFMVLVNVGIWVRLELRLRLVLGFHLVSPKVRKFEGS